MTNNEKLKEVFGISFMDLAFCRGVDWGDKKYKPPSTKPVQVTEPCADAICCSDVIDAIGSWMDSGEHCLRENAVGYLVDRIKKLPRVEPAKVTEPCTDAVSREAVLRINELHHGQMPNQVNHQIWEELKAMPRVEPAQRWIPVTEKLPENEGDSPYFTVAICKTSTEAFGTALCHMAQCLMFGQNVDTWQVSVRQIGDIFIVRCTYDYPSDDNPEPDFFEYDISPLI